MTINPATPYSIVDLMHSKNPQPVRFMKFLKALEETYDPALVKKTAVFLFKVDDSCFSGMSAFKERLSSYYCDNTKVSPDDQKYLADCVFKASIGAVAVD